MPKRTSIYTDSFKHGNPIPAACRIGNLLLSGIIVGKDPHTGELAATLDEQCALVFAHMRDIVEAGGGTTDDIIKVTVWMSDRSRREPVNREWLDMFPDPANRPARQAIQADLSDSIQVQCDFVAVLDDRQ
jgi:enamine deaminase RidA (YjgF/YER057c/UK114 family)